MRLSLHLWFHGDLTDVCETEKISFSICFTKNVIRGFHIIYFDRKKEIHLESKAVSELNFFRLQCYLD